MKFRFGSIFCILVCLFYRSDSKIALNFSQINVLVLTDVHSWISGHTHPDHEPPLNASYGDILSFVEKVKSAAADEGKDVFFVQNGDLNDGTGLSTSPPSLLQSIIRKMPFDALTTGNHELYQGTTTRYLFHSSGFLQHWNGTYLTSNVLNSTTLEHIGEKFTFLKGRFGTTVLCFGFLYDMRDADHSVIVRTVADVVAENWFREVLEGSEGPYDGILILGHMDLQDPSVYTLLNSMRGIIAKDVPIQFLTGHTHYRGWAKLDDWAASFEAGHYLDTIGFCSFSRDLNRFSYEYIDANVPTLAAVLGMSDFQTTAGRYLSSVIKAAQATLGLNQVYGCAPKTYYSDQPLEHETSLWGLYASEVVPYTLFENNASRVLIQSTGSLRYDLYSGQVDKNDIVTMCPFEDSFWTVAQRVRGSTLKQVMDNLNRDSRSQVLQTNRRHYNGTAAAQVDLLPAYISSGNPPKSDEYYDVFTALFDVSDVSSAFEHSGIPTQNVQVYEKFTDTSLWSSYTATEWPCDYFGVNNPARHSST